MQRHSARLAPLHGGVCVCAVHRGPLRTVGGGERGSFTPGYGPAQYTFVILLAVVLGSSANSIEL